MRLFTTILLAALIGLPASAQSLGAASSPLFLLASADVPSGPAFTESGPLAWLTLLDAGSGPETPGRFALSPARPNPFTVSTRLTLTIERNEAVQVAVFDALGRRVALLHDGALPAGTHAVVFEAGTLPGGLYVVRVMGADGSTAVRPIVLSR
ncbi:MAG TPA: T9SS type A sorting domain-containing protein [Rubricoccaceae bacterium]|nr:T9SS type A sorting domain-containing protein [Rubricoccaceae bacterium]